MRGWHLFSSCLISSSSTIREWISWKSRSTQGYTPHNLSRDSLPSSLTWAHNEGRDILMVFDEDVGAALARACGLDSDAVHLARAAQIVRHHMIWESKPFNGFREGCQKESIPSLLLGLVSMILEAPSIKDQMADTTPTALAIAQIWSSTASSTSGHVAHHQSVSGTPLHRRHQFPCTQGWCCMLTHTRCH